MVTLQGSLLDLGDQIALGRVGEGMTRRHLTHGAWLDVRPGWLTAGDRLLEDLVHEVPWQAERRQMYDSVVDVPRLTRFYAEGEPLPRPILAQARDALSAHYSGELGEPFTTAGMCLYRDGRDSVAWHGDRIGRSREQDTMIAKAQQAFIPQGLVDDVSDFAPPALTARAARVMFASKILHRLPAFNTVISNVPGPNVPIYLAGAKLLAHHPVSVVTDGIGLNITVIGYLGQLNFGLVAAREIVPDLADLMGWFGEELALLVAAAHAAAGNGSESEAHTEGNVSGRRSRGTAPRSGGRRPRSS